MRKSRARREVGAEELIASGDRTAEIIGRELQRSVWLGPLGPEEEAWATRIESWRQTLSARDDIVRCYVGRPGHQRSFKLSMARLLGPVSTGVNWGRAMLRLVRALRPSSCVEVGSAAGFSAAYQAAALELNGGGRLISIEASPECAAIARETLSALGLERAEVLVGRGEERLREAVDEAGPFQLAFQDDDHRRSGTIEMADRLVDSLSPGGALLIDDVHLSIGMRRAWRTVARDPRFAVAAGCGKVGVGVRRPALG
jgi:predicted O-methyltransferase YrrM